MLTREDNELMTRVGPGTPMGDMIRQYWTPVMRSSDLPERDSSPERIRLLGEDLVILRDTSGRVGLMAENCSHRGCSLFYGRNEEDGLRCIYHGWKYDVTGQCVDMPNEPAASNFKTKVRQRAYPCIEAGGMVWTYMGPRETPPPLPDLEWMSVPESHRRLTPFQRECNWVQALEGDIDTSHLYFLHGRLNPDDPPYMGVWHTDKHPKLEVVPTNYGVVYAANREEDPETTYWRVTQFMFPIHTLFPGYPDGTVPGHIWVPMDDYHTIVWTVLWNPVTSLEELMGPTGAMARGGSGVGEFLPKEADSLSWWRPALNRGNHYGQDREAQREKTFTGIPTIPLQDQAATESMGPIYDRTQEHLGTSDAMIIRVRRRLIRAARELRDLGVTPPGVDNPEWYRVRTTSATLPKGADWLDQLEEWLNARSNEIPEAKLRVPG